MKLYEIPRGSKIKEDCFNENGKIGEVIVFNKLDGMYSHCTVEGTDEVIHLSASTPLEKVGDYYIIKS